MRVIYLKEIDSTQNYAKKLIEEGESEFIVTAEEQIAGHGRHGRIWGSPKGGLWFSFVCQKPKKLPDEVFYLATLAVGVTVKEVLEEQYSCRLEIKWPNDILLNRQKVCGILCEKIEDRLICGIGINTNVVIEEIRKYNETATSFLEETGKIADNGVLMKEITERSLETIRTLMTTKENVIQKLNEGLAYKGEVRYLTYLKKDAEILGVDENGHLEVLENGEKKQIFAGEVL
ncbi:MAG: biotin--[acetyl-CoA-carboxylase] ligase [Clostridia bacterium]|nr:biotin--[acetyl-CoA-carboxylase] ligase [Clostridia bacterium]